MGKSRDEAELINRGRDNLVSRLKAELKDAEDEESVEQFLEAESVIDQYLDAVGIGSGDLPAPEDLAFSCALLLVTTKTLQQRDLDVLSLLNTPEVGKSLFAMASQISEIKSRSISSLKAMANAPAPLGDDELPF